MSRSFAAVMGERLRRERERLQWSQEQLAEALGTTSRSINRWERGKSVPQPYYRGQLCRIFQQHAAVLFGGDDQTPQHTAGRSLIWHVPYRRNLYFTGREDILNHLYHTFQVDPMAPFISIQSLSGLGGIGKTQTATEYAYRYANDYQAVLWLRADSREVLLDELAVVADLFSLPGRPPQESRHTVQTIQGWLNEHAPWLLILDNVEDSLLIEDLLPSHASGHILLTTRSPVTGAVARSMDLPPMKPEEGMLLLLRRAKRIEPGVGLEDASMEERQAAERITGLMDGLPLALDQAGGYIEETGCSLTTYLHHYQHSCEVLLARRNRSGTDHPHSVHVTFSLCYEQVQQVDPAAAELLCLCAFLYPEGIPEESIRGGAAALGPVLQPVANDPLRFDAALAVLRTYSLVRRDPQSRTLTLHRLVQVVTKQHLDEPTQRQWAERAIRIVHTTCLEFATFLFRLGWQQQMPHDSIGAAFLTCAALIEHWEMTSREAAEVLYSAGIYFLERQREEVALPLLHWAQALCTQRGEDPFPPPVQILEEYQRLLDEVRSARNA